MSSISNADFEALVAAYLADNPGVDDEDARAIVARDVDGPDAGSDVVREPRRRGEPQQAAGDVSSPEL